MTYISQGTRVAIVGFIFLLLNSCYKPPYNHFQSPSDSVGPIRAIGETLNNARLSLYKDNRRPLLEDLKASQIQYIKYGDTITLILPTDIYFLFNSARLNQVCYPGLACLVKVVKSFPKCPIYVAGFTDNVGSRTHKKKLTQARAEAMVTFLWGHGIASRRLHPEGYGDEYSVSNNKLIHGSAQNRRIEIQILTQCPYTEMPFIGYVK